MQLFGHLNRLVYMDNPKTMSDDELLDSLERLVETERKQLHQFLALLAEVDDRKILEPRGFSSTFDYCTRCLKLSEGEAYRRIQACRAAEIRPQIYSALADGRLSLTSVSKLAPIVRRADAPEIIARAEGKTTRQVDEILAPLNPEAPRRDLVREIVVATPYQEEARVEYRFQGSRELRAALDRVREVLSHRFPLGKLEDILLEIATDFLMRNDPLASWIDHRPAAPGSSNIRAAVRRGVWSRDGGRCTFVGPGGVRCQARKFLELDHIRPRALGGADIVENLRLLCRAHNDAERRRILGEGTPTSSRPAAATRGSP